MCSIYRGDLRVWWIECSTKKYDSEDFNNFVLTFAIYKSHIVAKETQRDSQHRESIIHRCRVMRT